MFPSDEDDEGFSLSALAAAMPPITHDFDQGPMSPVALAQDYEIEKTAGGRVMADYLKQLLDRYGQLDGIPEMQLLEQLFQEGKIKGTPRGTAVRHLFPPGVSPPADPRVKQLIDWGDRVFFLIGSWPMKDVPNREPRIFKIFNALRMGVKYCNDTAARNKFKIEFRGRQLWRRDQLFDTRALMEHYGAKGNYEMTGEVIWIMSKENPEEFYSHVGKLGRVHHSTFFGGEAVRAAGDWRVEQGVIRQITGRSGHYKPGIGPLIQALRILHSRGVLEHTDACVLVWEGWGGGTGKRVSLQELEGSSNLYRPYP